MCNHKMCSFGICSSALTCKFIDRSQYGFLKISLISLDDILAFCLTVCCLHDDQLSILNYSCSSKLRKKGTKKQ